VFSDQFLYLDHFASLNLQIQENELQGERDLLRVGTGLVQGLRSGGLEFGPEFGERTLLDFAGLYSLGDTTEKPSFKRPH
jgi:hypothetical protein